MPCFPILFQIKYKYKKKNNFQSYSNMQKILKQKKKKNLYIHDPWQSSNKEKCSKI